MLSYFKSLFTCLHPHADVTDTMQIQTLSVREAWPDTPRKIPYGDITGKSLLDKALGGNSDISIGRWNGTAVVIKEMRSRNRGNFQNERDIHFKSVHPNIVTLLGYIEERFDNRMVLGLVLENMERGDVFQYLEKHRGHGRDPIRKKIAQQALSAIAFLHAHNIIHRDIKSENLLIDAQFNIKLCDFGYAEALSADTEVISTDEFVGTLGWFDPGIYRANAGYEYDKKTDVFSCGILLSVLFSNENQPYYNKLTDVQLRQAVTRGELPILHPVITNEARALIVHCWDPNRKKRPTVSEVLDNPVLKDEVKALSI